jgi:protein-L-isoaspartate(D-aspartate) O-methyltransferase
LILKINLRKKVKKPTKDLATLISAEVNPPKYEWLARERAKMVEQQLKGRGISDPKVLSAFQATEREKFIPHELQDKAYEDHPLNIGYQQTISQPYIVAFMTESLELNPEDRVLEIGTGSGYQTAILAQLVKEVYSVETIKVFYEAAVRRFQELGFSNIYLRHGEGQKGWLSAQPFDKIMVTAGAKEIPSALIDQLKEGGRIIIPVGEEDQHLILGRKEHGILMTKPLMAVRFVPMQDRIA